MNTRFANACIELAKVERTYYAGDVTILADHQREYTGRRIVAMLAGEVAPTE